MSLFFLGLGIGIFLGILAMTVKEDGLWNK